MSMPGIETGSLEEVFSSASSAKKTFIDNNLVLQILRWNISWLFCWSLPEPQPSRCQRRRTTSSRRRPGTRPNSLSPFIQAPVCIHSPVLSFNSSWGRGCSTMVEQSPCDLKVMGLYLAGRWAFFLFLLLLSFLLQLSIIMNHSFLNQVPQGGASLWQWWEVYKTN